MAASGNPLATVAAQITGWVASARVVVTCRQNVWDAGKNALEGFDVYRNLDFDEQKQIPQFIRSVFQQSDLGEKLCKKLAESENTRLRDTVKNPLRLTLLCVAWHIRQGDFTTKTQADLYAQFTEAVYEWKREKFPTTSQQRRELNKALATLALRGMEQEESRFRLRQGWVREVLGETDQPLSQLALQLGWINRVGVAAERPEEQVYAFYHPTFQEYFAAWAVDDWGYFLHHVPDNPRLGTYRIFEKQWKQVILLWFGRENVEKEKKEGFIEALIGFNDGVRYFYYRAYFLAAAVLPEFKDSRFADAIVSQIVKWGFGYFDTQQDRWKTFLESIKEGAIAVLAETDRKRAIARLIQLLDETSDKNTREIVAESLGKIAEGNEGAIARLIQLVDETYDEETRRSFAYILGSISEGNEDAIAHLIQLLDETSDEDIRRSVAEILGKIAEGNERAIARLIQILDETSDKYICEIVAEFLSKNAEGNDGIILRLIPFLDRISDEDIRRRDIHRPRPFTREIVAEILGKIAKGNEGAIASLIQLLIQLLDETSDKYKEGYTHNYTRRIVAESLGNIAKGNEGAIARLIQLLKETSSEDTRSSVAKIFSKIIANKQQYLQVLPALKPNLTDKIYQTNFNLYKESYKLMWQCAQNLTYPQVYSAWYHQVTSTHPKAPDNIPVGNSLLTQSLEVQINDILTQLQPTTQTYPLPINIQSLADETDTNAIYQELCTLIYSLALPDTDIPTASNFAQLKQHILTAKRQLQKRHLALILHECTPHPTLLACCRKIADAKVGLHILWITDEPLEAPLRGFPPSQDNLLRVIQTWLEKLV